MPLSQLLTQNIPSSSVTDGTNPVALAGKAGEGIVAELHGKYYTAAYRGKHFMTQGAAAGTTIPVSSATAATFAFYNPIGSGVVAELGKLNIGILNATEVVSSIAWGIITGLIVAPTSVTAIPTGPAYLGSSAAALCSVYSAATLAAAATKFFDIFSVSATSGFGPNFNFDPEGSVLVGPGCLVHLVGTAAQTSASLNSLTWSEWAT